MRPRPAATLLCTLVALAFALGFSACGAEQESEAAEGEPVELAGLSYTVALTRFLNPNDEEDSAYLVGQPLAPPGTAYLGVFLTVANDTDILRPSATNYTILDTLANEYEWIESDSLYALDVANDVPVNASLPLPNTTAATGPNKASMLLFLVDDTVSDNRPLRLEIQSYAGSGEVTLDI